MRFFSTLHLLLFAYTVAALVFWGLSLQRQSRRIYALEEAALRTEIDSIAQPDVFSQRKEVLLERKRARRSQYIGEGATFLLIIMGGAAVVYTSYRRSLRLSRQQNNFMLAVTHELKSPLAGIKLSLQTMEKHQLTEEQRQGLIERCIIESDRLNDLCNNILLASQMEGRQHVSTREELDYSMLVEDLVDDYAARYPQRFGEDVTPGLRLTGDKLMLQLAVSNLLENAVKYSPLGTPIHVALHRKKNTAVLHVTDNGAGIPDREKKRVFEKFYRAGAESTRRTKGTGLGLYLTQKIIQNLKGRICVRDAEGGGSVFEVCLPLGNKS
jgi:signal transduction histidine kinase